MKLQLLSYSAAAAIAIGWSSPALAAANNQTPDTPAGATQGNPQPTVEEELLYLRERLAVQTLRMDEAEQLLQRQQEFIDLQEKKISDLERRLGETQRLAGVSQTGRSGPAQFTGEYRVKRGDTLYRISLNNNVSVAEMARANNLRAPYRLEVGQRLSIPGQPAPAQVAAAAPAQQQQQPKPKQEPAKQPQQRQAQQQQQKAPPKKVEKKKPEQPKKQEPKRVAAQQSNNKKPQQPSEDVPQQVGVRPQEEDKKPYISIFSDVGGILTPRGTFYAEPELSVSTSTDNRFFFRGTEIADAVLIGFIEATDTDRRAATARLGLRYGITGRFEVDARIAGVYRDDRVIGVEIDTTNDFVRDLEGGGLGDIDIGLKYQINQGRNWPYVIANVRAKAPTGKGPFDVNRDASGVETELATGSGFWTVEPSLTFILPTDPAVVFANVGYQYNMATSPNVTIRNNTFRRFNPGDAIKTSFGVGLSLNERMSVNFGYDQSYFLKTTTLVDALNEQTNEITTGTIDQPSAIVGSFLFGGSYAVSDRVRLNLNTAFGATSTAPDMRVSLRAQIKLFSRDKKK